MRAGKLRHRVTLQAPAEVANEYGQMIATWPDVGTFWAYVRPLQGREAERARQLIATATHAITMRWVKSLVPFTPQYRISFQNRILHLEAVLDIDERKKQIEILATEVV